MEYQEFLKAKAQVGTFDGFEPLWMPDFLFDFQKDLTTWAIRKGKAAILADCGLGKTPMQLVWAENVVRKTGLPVLILTPLAVARQTMSVGDKFGIEVEVSRDGKHGSGIIVTNYEMLHNFDSAEFGGVVCDESSILKSFGGAYRKQITRFMAKVRHRLLCTATAAPNDYIELGTSSEALGELTYSEMLKRFFAYLDDKGQKRETRLQESAEVAIESNPNYYKKLAFRISQTIGQWRLKHHAVIPFWRWVASWARACRMPSDLGYPDNDFVLPELTERDHIIKPSSPPPGMLFTLPAVGLYDERQERKRTLDERCSFAADLARHDRPVVLWCHMNREGDVLESMIPDARQVAGKTPDEEKIDIYNDFADGNLRAVIIKPKIGAWGLNWQHCSHVITFASHSYEQYYQSVRRCWRFGQKRPVQLDVIATEGEKRVITNMRSKAARAENMFSMLVSEMKSAERVETKDEYTKKEEVPSWL